MHKAYQLIKIVGEKLKNYRHDIENKFQYLCDFAVR